jgi:hypothetical protein
MMRYRSLEDARRDGIRKEEGKRVEKKPKKKRAPEPDNPFSPI